MDRMEYLLDEEVMVLHKLFHLTAQTHRVLYAQTVDLFCLFY
jgi:hypothetical protein